MNQALQTTVNVVEPPSEGVVHVWRASISDLSATLVATDYKHVLSDEETVKYQAYLARQAKLEFLLGRLMIRTLLSRYFPEIEPRDWKFSFNPYGKPIVENAPLPIDLSLSHSGGFVVLAFTLGAEVGIDIECARASLDVADLASSVFSPGELVFLLAQQPSRLAETFYRFWTLKEAYIKARGMGLSLPLDQFTFRLPQTDELPQRVSITFDSGIEDSPDSWWFGVESYRGHAVAIALKRDGKAAKILRRDFLLDEFTLSRSG